MARRLLLRFAIFALAASVFAFAVDHLRSLARQDVNLEMQVALPMFVQVALTGGDRFLAANLDMFRALVVPTDKMGAVEYRVLAKVQSDASWLNPAHQDNYMLAATVLAWSPEVDAAQIVLRRAVVARPYDSQPVFFYGFNLIQFKHDAAAASAWMRTQAVHLPDADDRLTTQFLASRWAERVDDLDLAIRMVDDMAENTPRKDFKNYLRQRTQRLRNLASLRKAAEGFRVQNGHPAESVDELRVSGFVLQAGIDFTAFALDKSGKPIFANNRKQQ